MNNYLCCQFVFKRRLLRIKRDISRRLIFDKPFAALITSIYIILLYFEVYDRHLNSYHIKAQTTLHKRFLY